MPLVQPRGTSRSEPSPLLIREQLARILTSDLFSRSERLSAFLTFIVEATLNGRGETLKEQVIAAELYGKGSDFSTAADPIVRVDARRLRDKLREYYASARHDPVLISVPKGSYTPDFEVNPAADRIDPARGASIQSVAAIEPTANRPSALPPRAEAPRRIFRRVGWGVAGIAVVASIGWLTLRLRVTGGEAPPVRLLHVTSFPGLEGGPPVLSPDGNFVAFAWTPPDRVSLGDLWVKAVDGDAMRRLTETPDVNEIYPAWSPDGQHIAFTRFEGSENRGIYVISALGGPERKVADWGLRSAWFPDSKSLAIVGRTPSTNALFQLDLETGARRQLTTPPGQVEDRHPKISPDGRLLAFVRCTRGQGPLFGGRCALFVVPAAGGTPMRLDDWVRDAGPPEWTPDSRDILYPRWDASGSRIFRVHARGGVSEPAAGLTMDSTGVSVSGFRSGGTFRVAVVEARSDAGVRLIDLHAPQSEGHLSAWTAFYDSTRLDWPARFSRDGTQVSFTSDRNGPQQIFVGRRDGSGMQPITSLNWLAAGLASWSPDSQFVVFDGMDGDQLFDLYVARVDGGSIRRLTHDEAREWNPEWSRDGRWIYYTSDRTGHPEIWKIPAIGGTPGQLTTQGGLDPREAPDGRSVYFIEIGNPYGSTTVKRMSPEGGAATAVVSGVRQGAWDVADDGIVFWTGAPGLALNPTIPDALAYYSFSERSVRRLGELPFTIMPRGYIPPRVLAVSPDRRWVLLSHMDNWERDVVVADNFR